eukprot:scaffold11434_cov127-Isochrysis_galbana.AAC.5
MWCARDGRASPGIELRPAAGVSRLAQSRHAGSAASVEVDLLARPEVPRGHQHRTHRRQVAQRLVGALRPAESDAGIVQLGIARVVAHGAGAPAHPLGPRLRVVPPVARGVGWVGPDLVCEHFTVDDAAA